LLGEYGQSRAKESVMNWKLRTLAVLALPLVMAGEFQAGAQQRDCRRASSEEELPPVWFARVDSVEQAIVAGDGVRAAREWPHVWTIAQASRRWDALLAAGDSALRIGQLTGAMLSGRFHARQAYRAALFRAYSQRSIDGVLRTAEASTLMGDREIPEIALGMARKLAATSGDLHLRDRVEQDAQRITARLTGASGGVSDDTVP
jgi:hypothetical protein